MTNDRVVVLLVASGAAWEAPALTLLDAHPGVVVHKRCVDVDELLGAASSGQADAAVIGMDARGLDDSSVEQLRRYGLRPVVVVPAGEDAARMRAGRIGVTRVVTDDELASLPEALIVDEPEAPSTDAPAGPTSPPPSTKGHVLVVWGPAGASGRTTVATELAAHLAHQARRTLLIDADPYGGAVAQQLGVLDEVSGLLQASRLAAAGNLDRDLQSAVRTLGPNLAVVTGLPRPDRWTELRGGLIDDLITAGRRESHVVVDTGFSLEADPGAELAGRPGRHQLTHDALAAADEIAAVGTADPVGLARLSRGLVELRELGVLAPVRVVVNRMRNTLGWSEYEVADMINGVAHPAHLHFLPEDGAAADKAMVAGRAMLEVAPDAALTKAIGEVADAVLDGIERQVANSK